MFRSVNHLKEYMSLHLGSVFVIDVECNRCERISNEAGTLYADDIVLIDYSEHDFSTLNHFYCQHCRHDQQLSVWDIRNMKKSGTLNDHIIGREEEIRNLDYQLWVNTFTNQMALIDKNKIRKTFSDAENVVFIPLENVDSQVKIKLQQKLNEMLSIRDEQTSSDEVLRNFLRTAVEAFLQPSLIDLDEHPQSGLILDKSTLQLSEAGTQSKADYAAINSYYKDLSYYLDPCNHENLSNSNYFNVAHNITVTEIAKIIYKGSIKPRKYYQILNSENNSLIGKYIELQLDPRLQNYVLYQLLDTVPNEVSSDFDIEVN